MTDLRLLLEGLLDLEREARERAKEVDGVPKARLLSVAGSLDAQKKIVEALACAPLACAPLNDDEKAE